MWKGDETMEVRPEMRGGPLRYLKKKKESGFELEQGGGGAEKGPADDYILRHRFFPGMGKNRGRGLGGG